METHVQDELDRAAVAYDAKRAAGLARNQRNYARRKAQNKAVRGERCAVSARAWEHAIRDATGLSYREARRARASARKEAAETGVSRLLLLKQRGLLTPAEALQLRREAAQMGGARD